MLTAINKLNSLSIVVMEIMDLEIIVLEILFRKYCSGNCWIYQSNSLMW